MEPELIVDLRCRTGEGPIWHPDERRLYWLDIPMGRVYRWDPATGAHEEVYAGDVVGGMTIQEDGTLLFLMERGAVKRWTGEELFVLLPEIPEARLTRFNDAIADPAGRVFSGTMPAGHEPSRLYRLDPNCAVTCLVADAGQSNGLGFTPDGTGLYWTDTRARTIYRFDYDERTGALANRRVFARVPESEEEGVPDGLTVDREGGVWSARWGGGCLVRYLPDGREERRIHFPARLVSSAAFGGDDWDELYVTTAGGDDKARNGPGAGALFRVRPGVRGRPEFRSQLHC